MLRQLLMGGSISLCNIAIHAIVMAMVVSAARRTLKWEHRRSQGWLAAVMVTTVGILMVAHVAEVIAWSDVLYFAFVNYTTLGYGCVVPVER